MVGLVGWPAPAGAAPPQISARLTSIPPTIDGRLDEPVWREARAVTCFVQRSPRGGQPPDQRTELRVLYDSKALYLGLRMWDARPELIRRGLSRRDNLPDSDYVMLVVDPLLSGDRGYYFMINASGVMVDGLIYQEVVMDSSWDAVWTGNARVDSRGWTAELRIPLTSLAFQDRAEQSWGIAVERHVQRIKQISSWPTIPKDSNTYVSRFGRLVGLKGLRRGRSLYLMPYLAGEVQLGRAEGSLRADDVLRSNGGLDLRYGPGGELMLHLALNPDFGEVEDDTAVVNLGPNEVFFSERRPFFIAGADLFRTSINLLHTRRIGARPTAPAVQTDDGEIIELDSQARIIGALKALGEVGPASYGVLSSVVLPSSAVERTAGGERLEREATPGRHYGAGRLRFRLGRGASSSIGLLMTGMTHLEHGADLHDAYAGGLDWELRSRSGWQTIGQLTGSSAAPGSGYGLWTTVGQRGAPRWRYWIEAESFSPDYEVNDVGYQWRANMVRLRPYLMRRLPSPWRFVREWYALAWGQYAFNHESPELAFDRRVELQTYVKLDNLWGWWAVIGHRMVTLDDRETRGGPVYPRPRELYGWIGGETNTARRLVLETTFFGSRERDALALWLDVYLRAALWDRLSLTLYTRWRRVRDFPRWVETLERAGDRDRHLFGDLDQDELEIKLSAVLGLHRSLTLQLFGQLLRSVGTHGGFQELVLLDDGQTTLTPTSLVPDGDYSTLTLVLNAVLRWDLGGGAAAYLVYKMEGALDQEGRPVRRGLALGGALEELWDHQQGHLLLFKLSYGWAL